MIQGVAFVEPSDLADLRESNERRASFDKYIPILRALDPDDFEALCAGILSLLGVDDPKITRRSADEGIDFYGCLDIGKMLLAGDKLPSVEKQLSVWLIGQAKRYDKATASTFHVRELVGSIELAKGRAFSGVGENYDNLRIRVCDPVFYLFFSTGHITAPTWKLVTKSGVIAMDAHMLAWFLAGHEIGYRHGQLDKDEFRSWVGRLRK